MLEILHISETGLKANQEWINTISHNVANIQTPGFKKSSVGFSELISSGATSTTSPAINQKIEGMGVQLVNPATDFSRGDFKQTGKPLDIAISGDGFLEIETEDGELAYTKLGHLSINNEGKLVAHDGSRLSADINVPSASRGLHIASNGLVTADLGNGAYVDIGTINIVQFNSPENLQSLGNQIYKPTKESGDAETDPVIANRNSITQGVLEMSNVNLVDEMGDLLLAQRAYQLNARLIQTADQILETINNLRR